MVQTITAKLRTQNGEFVVSLKAPGFAPERITFPNRQLAEEGLLRAYAHGQELVMQGSCTSITLVAIVHSGANKGRPAHTETSKIRTELVG